MIATLKLAYEIRIAVMAAYLLAIVAFSNTRAKLAQISLTSLASCNVHACHTRSLRAFSTGGDAVAIIAVDCVTNSACSIAVLLTVRLVAVVTGTLLDST